MEDLQLTDEQRNKLKAFLDLTGVEDVTIASAALASENWNLERAVEVHLTEGSSMLQNTDSFPTLEDVPLELIKVLIHIVNNRSARKSVSPKEIDDLLSNSITAESLIEKEKPLQSRRVGSILKSAVASPTSSRSSRGSLEPRTRPKRPRAVISSSSSSRMSSIEPQSSTNSLKETTNSPVAKKGKTEEEDYKSAPEYAAPSILKPQLESELPRKCGYCSFEELRVLDYGRKDGKHVLECGNRNCLKTLGLTSAIVGTVGPKSDKYPTSQWGWYLRDPMDLHYPSKEVQAMYKEEARRLEEYYEKNPQVKRPSPFVTRIENGQEVLYTRCPGQTTLVRVD